MAVTYGIISDMHGVDIKAVEPIIQILRDEGIDALVLNGDISGERSGMKAEDYLAEVLSIAGATGVETYIMPGSHEEVHLYQPVVDDKTSRYANLIDVIKVPKIEKEEHHLIFLPGSDWRAGNAVKYGYSLEEEHYTGTYSNEGKKIHVMDMSDLRRMVSEPDKTIIFSHVPRRFNDPETCVDMAEFWEAQIGFRTKDMIVEQGAVLPGPAGYGLAKAGAPIILKKENRGNKILQSLYEELGISKSITAHFHESTGRATDCEGKAVEEGAFVSSLFYNASCMDRLIVGMVSVDGTKAAYETINLREYCSR